MIHSARPTVSPVANIVFTWNLFCFDIFSKVGMYIRMNNMCENNDQYWPWLWLGLMDLFFPNNFLHGFKGFNLRRKKDLNDETKPDSKTWNFTLWHLALVILHFIWMGNKVFFFFWKIYGLRKGRLWLLIHKANPHSHVVRPYVRSHFWKYIKTK